VRNPARRKTTILTVVGMVLGGAGAAIYFHSAGDEPPPAAPPPPAEVGSPDGLAKAVVARLNAKDLTGVIDLTCTQGKVAGRRELIQAIPPLDPAAPAETRDAPLEFSLLDVREFPEGYVAGIRMRYQGTAQDGKMRLQLSGDKWTLCGMDTPRLGVAGSG
jgi:hypothetical protein